MRYKKLSPEEKETFENVCKRLYPIPKMGSNGEPIIIMDKVLGSYLRANYNKADFKKPKIHLIKDHLKYPWPRLEWISPRERLIKAMDKGIFEEELKKHMHETEIYLKWLASRNNTNNSSKNENNEEKTQNDSHFGIDHGNGIDHTAKVIIHPNHS